MERINRATASGSSIGAAGEEEAQGEGGREEQAETAKEEVGGEVSQGQTLHRAPLWKGRSRRTPGFRGPPRRRWAMAAAPAARAPLQPLVRRHVELTRRHLRHSLSSGR